MINFLWQTKLYWFLTILTLLIFHYIFVKPLILIYGYVRQGVDFWEFTPIIGPIIMQMQNDKKKKNDVMYSQKNFFFQYKTSKPINAKVTNIFSSAIITLYDPKLIKEFFINKHQFYEKSKMGVNLVNTLFGEGLVFSEGEKWRKGRRITSKLLTFEYLNTYIPMIINITNTMMSNIQNNQQVELFNILESITGTNALSIFFGRTIENEKLYGKSVADVIKEAHVGSIKAFMSLPFILSAGKILPKDLVRKSSDYKELLRTLVKEELLRQKGQDNTIVRLYAKEDNYQQGSEPSIELVHEITDQILNFFLAGRDTTSHQTLMMIYYICKQSELQKKLLIEIQHLTNNTQLNWENIKQLPYLEAIIKETQRMYGPAIGIASREAIQDHSLGNLRIKKGTHISVSMISNNYNPSYYNSPHEFNPERWLDSQLEDPFIFIPFSAGPRNCIGQHLSNIVTKIIIIRLFSDFQIQLDPEYQLKFDFTTTYAPISPMYFQFKRRK